MGAESCDNWNGANDNDNDANDNDNDATATLMSRFSLIDKGLAGWFSTMLSSIRRVSKGFACGIGFIARSLILFFLFDLFHWGKILRPACV